MSSVGDTAVVADGYGAAGLDEAGAPVQRTGSLIEHINSGVVSGPSALALGRRSAGITRLPPPTLD